MTPVLQTAVTGLIWAISVSLVIFAASFCADRYMRDRIGVDKEKEALASNRRENVAYLCDLSKECREDDLCVRNGGTCSHTTDIAHARNFSMLCAEGYYFEESKEDISDDD